MTASVSTLRRGITLNLAGQIAPAIGALVAIPVIQARLGTAHLGILTLAWAAVGYLGIFDLGFRRTLTRSIAALPRDGGDRLPGLVWTTIWSLGALGAVSGGLLVAGSSALADQMVAAGSGGREDARLAVRALAVALPAVAVSAGIRGALEGAQRFGLANAVQIPTSLASYLAPAAAALVSPSVAFGVMALAAARVAGALGGLIVLMRAFPAARRPTGWRREAARELASSGVWMMIANLGSASMLYLDRLLVGVLTPMAAVAYYTGPQELIGKLQVLSGAVSTTAFPALSRAAALEPVTVRRLFLRTTVVILGLLAPPALLLAAFAPAWLGAWLGTEFAAEAAGVARWVAIGTISNGLAAAPFALLQALGRARATAVIQLIEFAPYAWLLWHLTTRYGVEGAAAAWCLRVTVDAALLYGAVQWQRSASS